MRRPPLAILLADDDPDDVALIREALAETGCGATVHAVGDGEELLAHLRRSRTARPDLVLLDLNMPRMGGLRTLRELQADPALRSIAVVVLTTSTAPEDVARGYRLGAAAVLAKPATFEPLVSLLAGLPGMALGDAA